MKYFKKINLNVRNYLILKPRSEKFGTREWLALLIILPFSLGYLGLILKALFIISTSQELSQVAETLLFPVPLIALLTLIFSYYFKNHQNDGKPKDE